MALLRVPYKMLAAPVPPFHLTKENTALVLVDVQHFTTTRAQGLGLVASERGIDRELDEYYLQVEAALKNMVRLVTACRSHGVCVIHTLLNSARADRGDLSRQLRVSELPIPAGDPRAQIRPEVAPQAGELILPRVTYSPFASTDLQQVLDRAKVDTIILSGMLANYSVWMTARDAADRDFGVVVVIDALASETLEWHLQFQTGIVGGLIRQRTTSNVIAMLEGTRT
jgi:nicotinamidase-related amidase